MSACVSIFVSVCIPLSMYTCVHTAYVATICIILVMEGLHPHHRRRLACGTRSVATGNAFIFIAPRASRLTCGHNNSYQE